MLELSHHRLIEGVGLRNARRGLRQVKENHLIENIAYDKLSWGDTTSA